MRQFIQGSDRDFEALENKAKGRCIRYRNEEMPPGSTPACAHVGFEVDPVSGKTSLLVAEGVRYDGGRTDIGSWITAGRKDFGSLEEMVFWIRGTLAEAYESAEQRGEPAGSSGPQGLTDYEAVRRGLSDPVRSAYIDENSLASRLKEKVKGQDYAVDALAGAITRQCARERPSKPAVMFSVGPTGVGKTRTAELLPEILKEQMNPGPGSGNREYSYLRLDMNEYQEAHRVSQLLGAPQGYIGHGDGSQLVDTLKRNPRTIVLFDEIEKAHPSVLRVLMNAMDAGRLSAPSGRDGGHEVDCRNSVFMFTSNLNAHSILSEVENDPGRFERSQVDDVCRRHLRTSGIAPEILGRIGRFLVYVPLKNSDRAEILALSISETAREYGVTVTYIDPGILIDLFRKIGDGDFGVRPEKYVIDEELGALFAEAARRGERRIKVRGIPCAYTADRI